MRTLEKSNPKALVAHACSEADSRLPARPELPAAVGRLGRVSLVRNMGLIDLESWSADSRVGQTWTAFLKRQRSGS
jgi:hypothetical protein